MDALTDSATTALERLARALGALADALDGSADAARQALSTGLRQDLELIAAGTGEAAEGDDAAWLLPLASLARARLELARSLLPGAQSALAEPLSALAALEDEVALLALLRAELPPLLPQLSEAPRRRLEAAGVSAALASPRLLRRAPGEPPAELRLAGAALEALALELALARAQGSGEENEAVAALVARIQGALGARAAPLEVALGARPPEDAIAAQGRRRDAARGAGAVIELVSPGFRLGDRRLCQPVVVLSAGRASRLRAVLEDADLTALQAYESGLEGGDARDALEAGLPLLTGQSDAALEASMAALGEDLGFGASALRWIAPAVGEVATESEALTLRGVFEAEVEAGRIVRVLRPGARRGDEVLAPALAEVSRGEAGAGVLDELLDLLPPDDERCGVIRRRLEEARRSSGFDAGEQLARELSDVALCLSDELLGDAARLAQRLVIDEPPSGLAGVEGWESLRDFLDEHLEILLEDGEAGEQAVHRLTRPYYQALRHGDVSGCRLRSLGESLRPMLSLYDEALAETARGWLFAEMERLSVGGWKDGGHTRRLLRAAARAVSGFLANDDVTPALELTAALESAGLRVFPNDAESMPSCFAPEALFSKFEARYDARAPRFALLGRARPAVTSASDAAGAEPERIELGAVALSLGPEPALRRWLAGPELGRSRLGAARERLLEVHLALDVARLKAELRGDAGAEPAFARGLTALFAEVLKAAEWRRGDGDREALAPLFEVLERDHHLVLLPGYQSYRRLGELARRYGKEACQVQVERGDTARIEVDAVGALYREDVVAPMAMRWTVGPPPTYVQAMRQRFPWFEAVLAGRPPGLEMPARVREAILDFVSPDAGGEAQAQVSIGILAHWLAADHPRDLEAFCDFVQVTPGLEYDIFPLPGCCYTRGELLKRLATSSAANAFEIVRSAEGRDGEAVSVEKMAIYRDGQRLHGDPKARFSVVAWSQRCEEAREALRPLWESAGLLPELKQKLRRLVNRLTLTPEGGPQLELERDIFLALLDARLIDPSYPRSAEDAVARAGVHFATRLESEGRLAVERFQEDERFADIEARTSAEELEVETVFAPAGSKEVAAVRRPLVRLDGRRLQTGILRRGVPTSSEEVLEFDRLLLEGLDRLEGWRSGRGAAVYEELEDRARQACERTVKRLRETRAKMLSAAEAGGEVLPPRTARRDLVRFLIDQVHRLDDALAVREDKGPRVGYQDEVFRDLVFRSAGPYLSREFGIAIDTAVVAGADTQALTGRFKVESSRPKPKRQHRRIYSVVIPCYSQDGVTIRPATVRTGDY